MLRFRLAKKGLLRSLPKAKGFGERGAAGSMGLSAKLLLLLLKLLDPSRWSGTGAPRTRRMLLGKDVADVGVAGRTLTEWCGLRPVCMGVLDRLVETELVEEVEEALEWL